MTATATAAACSIEVEALNLWYGDFHALLDVDATVAEGGITALIGPSGCGKTTLLRCVNRLNERRAHVRTTGSVRVLGRNIYDPDVSLGELRKSVGMVFQRPNPLPLSIYENVAFGLRVHTARSALSRRRVDELVERALRDVLLWDDVRDRLGGSATALALDQQQKLCIARLLPLKPQIILMDEPCSALDAEGVEAIERLMTELKGPYTILIVTHNMAQARRVSDDCVFMMLGRMVEQGPTAEMFLRPRHKQTELYIEGRYG
jgi:phosphate transport system ATP-binding protein